jgi:hypothetical protein
MRPDPEHRSATESYPGIGTGVCSLVTLGRGARHNRCERYLSIGRSSSKPKILSRTRCLS